jgi:hypothetical protein
MPRLALVIKTVFCAMFITISFSGLLLACPFLPLYWIKPAGVPKLLGAWQILSF